jgi:hypothetical protein
MNGRRAALFVQAALVIALGACGDNKAATIAQNHHDKNAVGPAASHSRIPTSSSGSARPKSDRGHSTRSGSAKGDAANTNADAATPTPHSTRTEDGPPTADNQVVFYVGFGFGRWNNVQVGDKADLAVSPSNRSSNPITVVGISSSGDFTVTGDECSNVVLRPGRGCGFTVTFQPTAAGSRRGTVTMTTLPGPSANVMTLSGTAVEPISPTLDQTPFSQATATADQTSTP